MVPPGFDVPGFEPEFEVPGLDPGFGVDGLVDPLFGVAPGVAAPGVSGFVPGSALFGLFGFVAPDALGFVGFDPGVALPAGGTAVGG